MIPKSFLHSLNAKNTVLCAASLIGFGTSLNGATVYIGDSAGQGLAVTQGALIDTVSPVTYVSVATDNLAQTFVATETTMIRLTEVNFFRSAVAPIQSGSVTPFVAIYSGDLTLSSVNTQTNYLVVSIGDAYFFDGGTGGLSAGLENRLFTGPNPLITLSAGQRLVAGFLNTGSAAGLVTYDAALQNAIDYTTPFDALPDTVPGNLENEGLFSLNQTQKFNIGFVVVPEPSALLLSMTGLGVVTLRRRR